MKFAVCGVVFLLLTLSAHSMPSSTNGLPNKTSPNIIKPLLLTQSAHSMPSSTNGHPLFGPSIILKPLLLTQSAHSNPSSINGLPNKTLSSILKPIQEIRQLDPSAHSNSSSTNGLPNKTLSSILKPIPQILQLDPSAHSVPSSTNGLPFLTPSSLFKPIPQQIELCLNLSSIDWKILKPEDVQKIKLYLSVKMLKIDTMVARDFANYARKNLADPKLISLINDCLNKGPKVVPMTFRVLQEFKLKQIALRFSLDLIKLVDTKPNWESTGPDTFETKLAAEIEKILKLLLKF